MAGSREYPPAVLVHRPDCSDVAGLLLLRLPTAEIARQHPNGRMHDCYHFHQNSVGVVEVVQYPPHAYEPSTMVYADAVRALCGFCGGTHGVLDQLILPSHLASGVPGQPDLAAEVTAVLKPPRIRES
jgi:hypothetical protein